MTTPPIAIVGRGCVLPGALDPEQLWAAVREGRDLLAPPPDGSWPIEPWRVTTDDAGFVWSDRGGYVRGFDFDPLGFAMPAEEILAADRFVHWLLHAGRAALREAGHDGPSRAARVGAVLGNLSLPVPALSRFAEAVWLERQGGALAGGRAREVAVGAPPDAHGRFMSGQPARLLARALGLGAGAFALDAACASSLYALKLACDALHQGRADLMLAGAVCGTEPLFLHTGFRALKALSPSGRSRPFHRGADGLVPAEGAALLALKRLEDAESAGDRIFGVIRGVGLTNDGGAAGLLVPAEQGQVRAMRRAFEGSGLRPADVSLIECHATGTPVGDATEVRSMADVYAGCDGLPIGSLKSNLGHLLTVSGAAGILKVLGAMEAGVRPATLHTGDPNPALEGAPVRLLTAEEPWSASGRRLAAVSSFGFGGNNAHALIEEYQPGLERKAFAAAWPEPRHEIAVVGLGVIAASTGNAQSFADALLGGADCLSDVDGLGRVGLAGAVHLPARELRFPPRDLAASLPQQVLILKAAQEAISGAGALPPERTGVFVGMECDTEIARHMAWVRLQEWAPAWANATGTLLPDGWLETARAGFAPPLDSAAVLGSLPNIVTNRLNAHFRLAGPSFSVSADELSGVVALEVAVRALRAGELDAAVVGAVDLCCDPVHAEAAKALAGPGRQTPGDAAVVLVLKRLADAERGGDRVLALLETEEGDGDEAPPAASGDGAPDRLEFGDAPGALHLGPGFGHAHAASGLLHVAGAVVACARGALPASPRPRPWLTDGTARSARVTMQALGGARGAVLVRQAPDPTGGMAASGPGLRLWAFGGSSRSEVRSAVAEGRTGGDGPVRLAFVAAAGADFADKQTLALGFLDAAPERAPEGVAFREAPLAGEVAAVFTAAGAAYAGMGRDLLLALPELPARVAPRLAGLRRAAAWAYDPARTQAPSALEQLSGTSFLSQVHAELSLGVLGLRPTAAIGLSSGETNSVAALGAWSGLDGLLEGLVPMYAHELGGEFRALRRAWGTDEAGWAGWSVARPAAEVRDALAGETRAYLTMIYGPNSCAIGGEPAAVERALARLGGRGATPLDHPFAVHCPEVLQVRDAWRALHRRPTQAVPGVRFYTTAACGVYEADADRIADALLEMASGPVDFPAIVERAWADGVRIFVEHGPRALCTGWIGEVLRGREHLAVALDAPHVHSVRGALQAAGQLWVAGVAVDLDALNGRLVGVDEAAADAAAGSIPFASHMPPVRLPTLAATAQHMQPAPYLAPVLEPQVGDASPALVGQVAAAVAAGPVVPPVGPARPHPRGADAVPAGPSFFPRAEPVMPERPTPTPHRVPSEAVLAAASAPGNGASAASAAAAARQLAPAALLAPATSPPAAPPSGVAAAAELYSRHAAALTSASQEFVQRQSGMHQLFVHAQVEAWRTITAALGAGTPPVAVQWPAQTPSMVADRQLATLPEGPPAAVTSGAAPVAPVAALAAAAPAAAAVHAPVAAAAVAVVPAQAPATAPPRPPAPAAVPVRSSNGAHPAAATAATAPVPATWSPTPPPAIRRPGMKPAAPATAPLWTRADLEELSQGRISPFFGPLFEPQDVHERQVRMPMPPLLLADRVMSITAEPGTMGTGRIVTETDVGPDAWYLHDGCMPAGLEVEAGQADLLLISYMGADLLNQGERVYRLLGCEIVYHGARRPRIGDTVRYQIDVTGHARTGDVRLFFFQYDSEIAGEPRLSVRGGHAGFFTTEELANAGGVVWDPHSDGPDEALPLDAPLVETVGRAFSAEQVRAFAEGRAYDCFGKGFEATASHQRTPRIQAGDMQLFDEVTELDPTGGPWKRGYLRATVDIQGDEWFFPGHFLNDPTMPGTLMCEAGVQAMSFYLAALGYTRERDGWTFEPVPEVPFKAVCRGQVVPSSREMVYEIFVRGLDGGPEPTLWADVLLTVDGRKAFHGRQLGIRLLPDFPLEASPEATPEADPRPVAEVDGFRFDYGSLLHSANGRPSRAFGPRFQVFDGTRTLPRLPGRPYHFMSRVTRLEGELGEPRPGALVEVEYDVPPDAWYFAENGHPTMPFAVLLEAALQPCGWLTAYMGIPLACETDLAFRNLNGNGTQLLEVLPDSGTLRTTVRCTDVSRNGETFIESFDVTCHLGESLVYTLKTTFGHFPKEALKRQVGVPYTEAERREIEEAASDFLVDLRAEPDGRALPAAGGAAPALAGGRLQMLDRVTGYWPEGGKAGKGRLRAEIDVDPYAWFFKAHFYRDPVQPGSLGIEAMIQLLQFYMRHEGLGSAMRAPRFEPVALGRPMVWKYRGQVLPHNDRVLVELEISDEGVDADGAWAVAEAWLWVDGRRIYHASGLAMRMVDEGDAPPAGGEPDSAATTGAAASPMVEAAEPTLDAPSVGGEATTATAADATTTPDSTLRAELARIRRYWFDRTGFAGTILEDVYFATVEKFIGRIVYTDPEEFAGLSGRSLLYLGNHQTGLESFLLGMILPGLTTVPTVLLAKEEVRSRWLDEFTRHAEEYPGIVLPEIIIYLNQKSPVHVLQTFERCKERMVREGLSAAVHVEGTRALKAREPVQRVSSSLIDMALRANVPVVPFRLVGGLPVEPLSTRLHVPTGYGSQDYYFGAAIHPKELRALPYAKRRAYVADAINRLGPPLAAEEPNPADPEFGGQVLGWMEQTGASEEYSVLLAALGRMSDPSPETRMVLEGAANGVLRLPDTPVGRWMETLAGRLYGPRGPRVEFDGAP